MSRCVMCYVRHACVCLDLAVWGWEWDRDCCRCIAQALPVSPTAFVWGRGGGGDGVGEAEVFKQSKRCLIVTQLLLVLSSAVLYEGFKQLVLEQYKLLSCFIINCSCVRRTTNQGS